MWTASARSQYVRSAPRYASDVTDASTGSLPVVQALRRLGRADTTVFITHELTGHRRALQRERAIDAVIDQNPALETRVAVETMARLLGRLDGEPVTTVTDCQIYMAENA